MGRMIHTALESIRANYRESPVIMVFAIIMVVAFLISFVLGLVTFNYTFDSMLVWDNHNTFMDHFNSVMYSLDNPYSVYRVCYPPLITTVYAVIGYYTSPYVVDDVTQDLAFDMRESKTPLMVFILLVLVSLYVFHVLIRRMLDKKEGIIRSELIFLLLLFSFPVLYTLERGNSLIYTVLFMLCFLSGYASENKIIRYLSYVCLGIATGIKISPAILIFLLLRDNQYREFFKCLIIIILLFFVPFIFTDGNPLMLAEIYFTFTDEIALMGGIINIRDMVYILSLPGYVSTIISLILVGVTLYFTVFAKKIPFWEIICMNCCTIVLCFSVSAPYLTIYPIIPFLFFAVEERKLNVRTCIFALAFAAIFMWMPGINLAHGAEIIGSIKAMVVLGVLAIIYYECVRSFVIGKTSVMPSETY